jgi:hypothetical protein
MGDAMHDEASSRARDPRLDAAEAKDAPGDATTRPGDVIALENEL